jgi:transcriptional regulator with XRE-family HTH domain
MPPKAPTEIDQLVGRRVREQRLRVGLSQAKLAQLLGITVAQLHKYETGVNRIGASRLHQIARLLQVPVGFFFEAQEGADASRADVDGTQVTDQQTSELVKAFSRITNSAMRRALLDLARAAAHSEETSSDKTSSKP